ncbi:hypothetical protein NX059_000317 [Plenodomus lindquistii]|nr:hypothetical protein NX059_000317 [Plenodomus lindquistii]
MPSFLYLLVHAVPRSPCSCSATPSYIHHPTSVFRTLAAAELAMNIKSDVMDPSGTLRREMEGSTLSGMVDAPIDTDPVYMGYRFYSEDAEGGLQWSAVYVRSIEDGDGDGDGDGRVEGDLLVLEG